MIKDLLTTKPLEVPTPAEFGALVENLSARFEELTARRQRETIDCVQALHSDILARYRAEDAERASERARVAKIERRLTALERMQWGSPVVISVLFAILFFAFGGTR